ncbi:uncharacterized protein LOC112348032 [Selaginella moellendorffii]|uniref:uncharacterized protein LOC112348032 n=1 Tax=Selaginella moellendorffii TaxID=88036 RepID=UPI000D1CC32B|nr:uncharacterized protein LOC112348032 [Selaginella moellendorffii]|eukprot:XP_024535709.1 uncharacterized protein LOC112348032 [Selaginella moellendorffii]
MVLWDSERLRDWESEMGSKIGTLPCFTKTITRVAVSKDYPGCLPIPKEFHDEQRGKLASEAVLKINSHKKWVVKVAVLKSSTYAFRGPGWTAFARDNELEIDDQVMFTMLSPSLFSVKITRAGEDSDARRNVKVKQEQPEVESAVAETAMPGVEEETVASKFVEDPAAAATAAATAPATATTPAPESEDQFELRKRTAQEQELEHGPPSKAARLEDGEVHAAPVAAATPVTPASEMVTPERAERRQSLGTAQEPLEIDMSGGRGAAEEAGIHLVLKTERKNFKVFISVSAIEAAAAANPAAPEPDVTNNTGVVENPAVTAPDTPVAEPENPVNVLETKPQIAAASDATAATAATAAAAAATTPLPRITIPIRTTNVAPYSRLTIEKAFALRWLPPQTCMVKLVDRAGKEWEMRWIVARKRMLTQGWSAIVKHYKMRIGDLCTLEVVNPRTLRFFVTDSLGAVVERH